MWSFRSCIFSRVVPLWECSVLAMVVYVTAKFVNSLSSLTKVLRLFQNGVGSSACCAGVCLMSLFLLCCMYWWLEPSVKRQSFFRFTTLLNLFKILYPVGSPFLYFTLVYSSRYGMSYMLRCKVWDLCFGRVLLEFYVSMKLRTGSTFEHVLLMKLRE